jgi:NAD(P)-dependent dehydrogenase (short-subunit alcohol dehydrogenase family)
MIPCFRPFQPQGERAWAPVRLDKLPENGWNKVMNLNVKSAYFVTQSLLDPLQCPGRPGQG